ncbi:MAG: Holliday junction resolvase RuvX [Chloroflexi bacterium HGW-Chloroflexi-10]|nr:MAG: Holliday junction resolvase RuvX [Chloroflexi bacterium HGW-Chloroflexi-10]
MIDDFRILSIDPGDKRIGIAMSDLSATIASPNRVLPHVQRLVDAKAIVMIAKEFNVKRIVVGQALDIEGLPTPSGRKAARLAEAIQSQTDIPVVLWDESYSTNAARTARKEMGVKREKQKGHLDDLAATVILQTYLDENYREIHRAE